MRPTKKRRIVRVVTPEERLECRKELDREFPGYLEEDDKLRQIAKILTGVRFLYALFYIAMSYLYDLDIGVSLVLLLGTLVFYVYYRAMLQSGRFFAFLMLILRGRGIVTGGVSVLQMSFWLPYPLTFALAASVVIEFVDAVFCIYIIFNRQASQTVALNREIRRRLSVAVSAAATEQLAAYENEYHREGDGHTDDTEED